MRAFISREPHSRFYALIPHNFGIKAPPPIDTQEPGMDSLLLMLRHGRLP